MKKWFFLFVLCIGFAVKANAQETIDLSGYWSYATGRITDPSALVKMAGAKIVLPGSILTDKRGGLMPLQAKNTTLLTSSFNKTDTSLSDSNQFSGPKLASLSQSDAHYTGTAWYWKSFSVPKDWKKSRVFLCVGRPHIQTTVYVNNKLLTSSASGTLPFQYDITPYISCGCKNQIVMKVDNEKERVALAQNANSLSSVQSDEWNGIGGKIELQARSKQTIYNVRVGKYDAKRHSLQVFLQGDRGFGKDLKFLLEDSPVKMLSEKSQSIQGEQETREYHLTCYLDKWDEYHPNTYELGMVIKKDTVRTVFGIRDISTKGGMYYINGRSVAFHVANADGNIPLSSYLSADVDAWFNLFKHYREKGVNALCFNRYCPPEAAFTAADYLGFYLEMGSPSLSTQVEKGYSELPEHRNTLKETKYIVDLFGNHPSFVMMVASNDTFGKSIMKEDSWIKEMNRYDPKRIYCNNADPQVLAWNNSIDNTVKEVRGY